MVDERVHPPVVVTVYRTQKSINIGGGHEGKI